jgi:hypothetical protein
MHMRRVAWFMIFLGFTALAGGYSVHQGTDANFDLQNYHLYDAFAALTNRYTYDFNAAGISQSYLSPVLDFPFYGMLLLFNDHPILVAFLQGAMHSANLLCITLLAWHLFRRNQTSSYWQRPILSFLAVLIGATGAGSLSVIGTTTNDVQSTIPCLWALFAVIVGIDTARSDSSRALRLLAIGGFAAGVAVGFKLTTCTYAIALTVSLICLPRRFLPRAFAWFFISAFIGLAITGAPHFLRMYVLFQNPIFPYYNNIFKSPYFEPIGLFDERFLPKSLMQYFTYPFMWAGTSKDPIVTELPLRDTRFAFAIALGAATVVSRLLSELMTHKTVSQRETNYGMRALVVFAAVSYILWVAMFSIYRYFILVELVTGILIIAALNQFLKFRYVITTATAISALCIVTTIRPDWHHITFGNQYLTINKPDLPSNTFVLIGTNYPVGYTIPFFDYRIRWAKIDKWTMPDRKNLLAQNLAQAIRTHHGPFMLEQDELGDQKQIAVFLEKSSLERVDSDCKIVSSNFEPAPLKLCPLRHFDNRQ